METRIRANDFKLSPGYKVRKPIVKLSIINLLVRSIFLNLRHTSLGPVRARRKSEMGRENHEELSVR